MHKCPHCAVAAVPGVEVRWSDRSTPATCKNCGKLSHVLASTSNGIFSMGVVLLCFTVFGGLVAESYLVGMAGVGLVVAYNMWAWRQVELFPISAESAGVAAGVKWGFIAIAALIKIFSS